MGVSMDILFYGYSMAKLLKKSYNNIFLNKLAKLRDATRYQFSCFFIKLIKGGGGHSRL